MLLPRKGKAAALLSGYMLRFCKFYICFWCIYLKCSGSWKACSTPIPAVPPIFALAMHVSNKLWFACDCRGGLSNLLYKCYLSDNLRPVDGEPVKVLLRIYGQIIRDNPETVLTDSVIFALLAEKNMGPRLYGIFTEGRVEEYVPVSWELDYFRVKTKCDCWWTINWIWNK